MSAVERPRGIGGSDAAAAIGLNPYESPVGLWLRLTGRVPETVENEAMAWGTRLQPTLAEAVEREGYAVMPAPADPFVSDVHPFMFGHVDGFCAEVGAVGDLAVTGSAPHGDVPSEAKGVSIRPDAVPVRPLPERGVLELKTAGPWNAKAWDADEIPLAYQAQGLHYMAVTGLPFVVFGCLIGGQRFVVRRMERDDKAIALLTEREAEFWSYVEADSPPPPEWATADDLARLFPDSDDGIVALDDAPELVDRLRSARAAVEVAKAERDEAETAIKARMGLAATATLHGGKVVTWKSHTAKRVDVTRLKEELPDVHAEYLRESGSRVFRVY